VIRDGEGARLEQMSARWNRNPISQTEREKEEREKEAKRRVKKNKRGSRQLSDWDWTWGRERGERTTLACCQG